MIGVIGIFDREIEIGIDDLLGFSVDARSITIVWESIKTSLNEVFYILYGADFY